MIRQIIRYIFPFRRLYKVPHEISAEYDRSAMTPEERLIMMAGGARDPQAAHAEYKRMKEKHGEGLWAYLKFELRRKRSQTAKERFMMLLRRALGEDEPQMYYRRRKPEARVYIGHKESD